MQSKIDNLWVKAGVVSVAMSLSTVLGTKADVVVYDGPINSNTSWALASNWIGGVVPGAGDTADINPDVQFNSIDGQSIGAIENAGKKLLLNDGGVDQTFTFDNDGSTATVTTAILGVQDQITLGFTDDLTITATNEISLAGQIVGSGLLTMSLPDGKQFKGWGGGVISVGTADISGVYDYYSRSGHGTIFAGSHVYVGSNTVFVASGGDFEGLNDASLEMDTSYALFTGTATNDALTLTGWSVGGTTLGAGTYSAASASVSGIDFATIFGTSGVSITVVPEPGAVALIGVGGLCLLGRRSKA